MQNGSVYSDTINDTRNGSNPIGLVKTYIAIDGDIYSEEQIPLDEYLSYEPEFSLNGEAFDGEVPNNSLLKAFLNSNERLRKVLQNNSSR